MKWVLITGCSSGIGRALVGAFRAAGWGVVATARNPERLAELGPGPDLRILALDVTDAASICAAVAACSDLDLTALVNNAGYGQMGPLELLKSEELRTQLETNVIGLHAVTVAFLPLLRKNSGARIVHIASVLGRLSIPMAGAYNASKHAVVALGETLRVEIGREIPVILVEPGSVRTEFRNTLVNAWGDLPKRAEGTPYHAAIDTYRRQREAFAAEHGLPAEACAQRIVRAVNARRPPRRLVVGSDSYWGQVAHRILPAWLFEAFLRRTYGL
ncbi:MAG TPA: SDR family oxidoreductase [Holophaga sp.]|jgi:NAD(P)-dependent dehydrogenase (short-subunit alcohol dehydrogenase family)|nr:SDR family oxidoreductase [Holophaga sp.]